MKHKCQWYEKGERSSTFFLDLEEFTLKLIQICKITVNVKEAPDLDKIQYDIDFFLSLFKKGDPKTPSKINNFLGKVQLSTLKVIEVNEYGNELSEKDLYMSLKTMQQSFL